MLPKTLALCALVLNRNMETDFGGKERWLYFFARQEGKQQTTASRTVPHSPGELQRVL